MKLGFTFIMLLSISLIIASCSKENKKETTMKFISKEAVAKIVDSLASKYPTLPKEKISKGISQSAMFWTEKDGSAADFEKFCYENYIGDTAKLREVFQKLSFYFEVLNGHYNKITLDLNRYLHLDCGEIEPIDILFGAYNPAAHFTDDFFQNKIAFYIIMNFPFYTLEEKTKLGENWTRIGWAYARMGDLFTARIPAELIQKVSEAYTAGDTYISEYNIYAGFLTDDNGKTFFPPEMKLISHWNLRDELKSQYGKPDGLEKQKLIYEVMKRIISQEIPKEVINSNKYYWNPYTNKVTKDGNPVETKPEPNTRYQMLLNNFLAQKAIDPYTPYYPTYIERKFDAEMEIPQKQVEELFVKFVSSETVRKVGKLIEARLGRKLEPFDIWYDGFKARSSFSQDDLTAITRKKYKTKDDYKADFPNILTKLGFDKAKAEFISSKIDVDAARGAGHAWGADMKSENAHLRTRVGKDGMDYKGYNIATHEFGHNVEQTLTLQNVDYYALRGVPNTAFTEAWAFIFQHRDLDLLGMKETNPNIAHLNALDNLWMTYEIMGVSLVDMNVWKWLYAHPNATAEELKKAVIEIAIDIWNKYYADVFGIKDQPILAIYSHMIDNPLYLSAYPIGHLIEFQIEQFIKDKVLGKEMERMCVQGRIIPQLWMKGAVGQELSIEPTLKAAEEALNFIK